MKCPNKNKFCTSKSIHKSGGDFICTGITTKPTKWKKDNIKLCLCGTISKGTIEMTPSECFLIANTLLNALI